MRDAYHADISHGIENVRVYSTEPPEDGRKSVIFCVIPYKVNVYKGLCIYNSVVLGTF